LERWNGIGLLPQRESRTAKVYSDASGNWGCAAVFKNQWFQWQWSHQSCNWHIAPKELLPIVLAMLIGGEEMGGAKVVCYCDNSSVVEVHFNRGYSKNPIMMHMVRCLFFITEHHHLSLEAVHLPGKINVAADALSHNNWSLFLQLSPGAMPDPSPIPDQTLRLLVEEQPDWTPTNWTELFVICTRQA